MGRARPVAMGTRRTDVLMPMGMQQMGDRPMAACTRYSGDDLDTGAIHHPNQQKMTKRQWTGIILMAIGTQHVDFGPRVKANPYLKRAQEMGKSQITANMQRTNSGLMVVSQWTVIPRVVAEQQTNTCS